MFSQGLPVLIWYQTETILIWASPSTERLSHNRAQSQTAGKLWRRWHLSLTPFQSLCVAPFPSHFRLLDIKTPAFPNQEKVTWPVRLQGSAFACFSSQKGDEQQKTTQSSMALITDGRCWGILGSKNTLDALKSSSFPLTSHFSPNSHFKQDKCVEWSVWCQAPKTENDIRGMRLGWGWTESRLLPESLSWLSW